MRAIPHHRMPVILEDYSAWLSGKDEEDYAAIQSRFSAEDLNAYPLLDKYRTADQFESIKDLEPIGRTIRSTEKWKMNETIKLQGMGFKRGYQNNLFSDESSLD